MSGNDDDDDDNQCLVAAVTIDCSASHIDVVKFNAWY
jgi:hypothetical protein